MKHSQKMILIPENNLDNYLRQQRLTTPPTVTKMAQLDGEMRTILDRNDTSQDEKAKLYSQILENFLHFKGKRNVENTEPIPVQLSEETKKGTKVIRTTTPDNVERQSVGGIIEVLPKNLQQKAKILLRRIQDNSKILDWNDRGELKYDGETLPNTNITNLLGDSLKYKKNNKPKGYEIFTKALSEMNLPEELIRNPERLQLFKTYGYEKTPDRGKVRKPLQNDIPDSSPTKKRAKKLQWQTNF
jgi:hypothetical protein